MAHFATFPERLVEPMILAGTSEKGCCPRCRAPWRRVVDKEVLPPPDRIHNNGFKHFNMTTHGEGTSTLRNVVVQHTAGWEPTCDCNVGDPVACLVMDIFSGTATVGKVAVKHRRRFVGLELNPAYIALALRRTDQTQMTLLNP